MGLSNTFVQIFVSCASVTEAEALVKGLLEQRWVACGQILNPMQSFYRWQGHVEHAQEVLLILKSQSAYFDNVKQYIIEHHSYDVPEIIAVPVSDGNEAYLQWLHDCMDQKND